ncbi:hypothetical protein FA15DRAFT_560270, partial [Coprinopsis marcescibilis]
KSQTAQLALLNDAYLSNDWDVILLQESSLTYYRNIRTPSHYTPINPPGRHRTAKNPRSGIWVNTKVSSNTWQELDVPNTIDITAVHFRDGANKLSIFKIYN